MGVRTERQLHVRVSRRCHEGLRVIASHEDTTVAELVRRELSTFVNVRLARARTAQPYVDENDRDANSGTGSVPNQ